MVFGKLMVLFHQPRVSPQNFSYGTSQLIRMCQMLWTIILHLQFCGHPKWNELGEKYDEKKFPNSRHDWQGDNNASFTTIGYMLTNPKP
jgi:hypothetical protein